MPTWPTVDAKAGRSSSPLCATRYFVDGYMAEEGTIPPNEFLSPQDVFVHGSHTTSSATGAAVANASVLGFAKGTARGILTSAKIAMYKACWCSGCDEADILDRSFPVQLQLRYGATYVGQSLYKHKVEFRSMVPLVYGGSCFHMKTRLRNITGKIIVCKGGRAYDRDMVKNAGGAGIVTVNPMGNGVLASMITLPSLTVEEKDGWDIVSYINNTHNPEAAIKTKAIMVEGRDRAPEVAFSSRNPNPLVPELLKAGHETSWHRVEFPCGGAIRGFRPPLDVFCHPFRLGL